MELILQVLLSICAAWFLVSVYFLIRNQWVYNQRIKMIESNMEEYLKLPDYNTMLYNYWAIWDMDKMPRIKK